MANFKESFDKVILAEGGYVNDPDDAGGETYLGISRVNHPYSKIWDIIDSIKKEKGTKNINSILKQDKRLIAEVENIYKNKYWDALYLDEVYSQKIAHQLFDDAVNRGVGSAIRVAEHVMGMTPTGKFSDALLTNLRKYGKTK